MDLDSFNIDGRALAEAELQELLKDKTRLDWLSDVNNNIGNVLLPTDIVERNLGSLRDAIDEAMKRASSI